MKKNAMLKIAAILLVAVLLTTCAISTTFAKYVTNNNTPTSDSARVAKWGLTFTGTKADLFTTGDGHIVGSSDETNVVAPGTNATGDIGFVIEGKPEVAFELSAEVTVTLTGWEVDGNEYCPLKFTVDGETSPITITSSIANFEKDIANAIAKALVGGANSATDGKAAKTYYVDGTDFNVDGKLDLTTTVAYEWPFEVSDENNTKDTALGNAAAEGNAPTVTISYIFKAVQVNA